MQFSTSIPDRLQEYPDTMSFMKVLDELQNFKTEIMSDALRVHNAAILMDRKWLIKKLGEFGVTDIPYDYPLPIIRQYLLNVDTVCGTRGSKIGVQLYCSLLSLGLVEVDDSEFYNEPEFLLLNSRTQGYITEDSSKNRFYLVDDFEQINKEVTLNITVKSKYFNGDYPSEEATIKNYLESTIGKQLGFSPNKKVNFTYSELSYFYFHRLLNTYFV